MLCMYVCMSYVCARDRGHDHYHLLSLQITTDKLKFIQNQQPYIHVHVCQAAAYPSCQWVRVKVPQGQVTSLPSSHTTSH